MATQLVGGRRDQSSQQPVVHLSQREGGWEGWVSLGVDAEDSRRRKHVRGATKREVAEKVA